MNHGSLRTGNRRRASRRLVHGGLGGLVLVLMLMATVGSTASAQSWFDRLFQPFPQPQQAPVYVQPSVPRAIPHRRVAKPKRRAVVVERPVDKPSDKPAVPPSYVVAVLGDSLGQILGQGLTDAFADRPDVGILRKARENTGLVRDDYYDWIKATRELLAGGEKIDIAVMLIGVNDRQSLRDAGASYEPLSPKWTEIYKARIATLAAMFKAKKIPLLWVGLPIVKSERLAADFLTLNDLYREEVAKAGGTYIDIWEAFGDVRGQYSPFGPDVDGHTVRLRASDGIHFTRTGARKLAHFVDVEIARHRELVNPEAAPAIANAQPAASASLPAAIPLPVKPVAGPVLPLTVPAIAVDGELARRHEENDSPSNPTSALIQTTLARGKPPKPKPGRADDSSWSGILE